MRKELLDILHRDAFIKKQVVLASGKVSNYYVDVRRVSLNSRGIYLIANLMWPLVKEANVTAVGGLTMGADPIVTGICMVAAQNGVNLKGFLVRKEAKGHGQKQLIEGPQLSEGERVIVVDDVATSASSIIKAIEAAREAKLNVVKAMCVLDRGEGATENLTKLNCSLVSLYKKEDMPV